jgi:hypothetical protein
MTGIVQEIRGKIKSLLEDPAIFTSLLLLLVAIASFGLGRQSVTEKATEIPDSREITTLNTPPITESPRIMTASEGEPRYVASKNGKVYHLLICPGAKQINEANKIYFNTKEEAEAAGLRPAANCKGI